MESIVFALREDPIHLRESISFWYMYAAFVQEANRKSQMFTFEKMAENTEVYLLLLCLIYVHGKQLRSCWDSQLT